MSFHIELYVFLPHKITKDTTFNCFKKVRITLNLKKKNYNHIEF